MVIALASVEVAYQVVQLRRRQQQQQTLSTSTMTELVAFLRREAQHHQVGVEAVDDV